MHPEADLELFQRRASEPLYVCREPGGRNEHQDQTDARRYHPGELVELKFAPTLQVGHPECLKADVRSSGDRLTIQARHDVFSRDGRALIASGPSRGSTGPSAEGAPGDRVTCCRVAEWTCDSGRWLAESLLDLCVTLSRVSVGPTDPTQLHAIRRYAVRLPAGRSES